MAERTAKRQLVTCIIPAYNEAPRISGVLEAVKGHPLIGEVIVVNDGSTDETAAVARRHKHVTLLDLHPNGGKSHAVMKGLEAAKHSYIMMLDADLVGLTHADLDALIKPVLESEADITLSLRANSLLIYRVIGLDFVSGERVFAKAVIGDPARLGQLKGYGLEVIFNHEIIRRKLRLRVVKWHNVISVRKGDKVGFWTGLKLETAMIGQILKTVGLFEVLRQLWCMNRLKRRGAHGLSSSSS